MYSGKGAILDINNNQKENKAKRRSQVFKSVITGDHDVDNLP